MPGAHRERAAADRDRLGGRVGRRWRILEEPTWHLPLLRAVAATGLGIGALGGLLLGLVAAGWLEVGTQRAPMLFNVSGLLAGRRCVAVFSPLSRS